MLQSSFVVDHKGNKMLTCLLEELCEFFTLKALCPNNSVMFVH